MEPYGKGIHHLSQSNEPGAAKQKNIQDALLLRRAKRHCMGLNTATVGFEFNGVAYPNEEELTRELTAEKQKLVNEGDV